MITLCVTRQPNLGSLGFFLTRNLRRPLIGLNSEWSRVPSEWKRRGSWQRQYEVPLAQINKTILMPLLENVAPGEEATMLANNDVSATQLSSSSQPLGV